ncbi:MAG: polyprenyl synthetase family protein [Thermoguttaceae bacterium]|nr:polyprenyl synthetase family protein [Thermoguttaceae bacterium]MDW8038694.1 polyprenyl synthetase family protein [Thermoguttaceae bacterium]
MASAKSQQTPDQKDLSQSTVAAIALGGSVASGRSAYPKQVPASRAVREAIRQRARQMAAAWDCSRPLSRQQIEQAARRLLAELDLPEQYLGWTMVMVGSAFWQPQVAAVPVHRRLLLLPHCFRSTEKCQGSYTAQELLCRECGACRLCFLRAEAKRLGYQVLIAEGTPIVIDMILHGRVDAILGIACLDSLERALDKILQVGIPCMAVPLWESRCQDSQTDEDWVLEMLRTPYVPSAIPMETYLHLLRATTQLFQPQRLSLFLPGFCRCASASSSGALGSSALSASALPTGNYFGLASASGNGAPVWEATERLAWDFLLRGGKHLRPFLTLAAYDAMTGGQATQINGQQVLETWPAAIWQLALAIELFHKASLVHDDIEDDDPYRYGQPTLHRQYGVPVALNVGDFLLGWGYRLAGEAARHTAPEAAADILRQLALAHIRLSEGQGAELAWRHSAQKSLSPLEVMKIYTLKTAPAFEAALYVGLRLAGQVDPLQETLARYSRQLGVAFQIQNDLADWRPDNSNKRPIGADVFGARPTILWALARQSLGPADAARLDLLLTQAVQLGLSQQQTTRNSEYILEDSNIHYSDLLLPMAVQPNEAAPIPEDSALDAKPPEAKTSESRRQLLAEEHFPPAAPESLLAEVRHLYQKADVFAQAETLLEKHRQRAHQLADQTAPPPLKRLLHYVADMIINQ